MPCKNLFAKLIRMPWGNYLQNNTCGEEEIIKKNNNCDVKKIICKINTGVVEEFNL